MLLNNIINKKILIWGLGIEGISILKLLQEKSLQNILYVASNNANDAELLKDYKNVKFISQNEILNHTFEIVVKSPGISVYSDLVIQLKKNDTIITSILNIFLAEINEYKKINKVDFPKTIGITATKGKSTSCSMANHSLNKLGFKSIIAGNIGIAVLDIFHTFKEYDYIVLETSSIQASTLTEKFDYGILLNLFPEHIDWHKTHENYYNDKINLLKYSKKQIVNADLLENTFFNVAKSKLTNLYFYSNREDIYLENNSIYDGKFLIYNNIFDEIQNLAPHIYNNFCSILTMAKLEKIDLKKILETLIDFKGLKHRLELFYYDKKRNIKFIDDSISTIPESVFEALKFLNNDNLFLILGGFEREQDYKILANFIKNQNNIKFIFLVGANSKRIEKELELVNFQNKKQYENYADMILAIKDAITNDATFLLSPAAASYDMFKNFEKRGDFFQQELLKLID